MSLDKIPDRLAQSSAGIYRFGSYELDAIRRRLTCDGSPVAVGDRALDILIMLVKRAGEVVPKDELIAFAWPNTFVHEANLKVHISALRRIIGETGREERMIVNVVGRGYMFVGAASTRPGSQLVEPAEAADLARPDASPAMRPGNLPQPPNSLVGREDEMNELRRRLSGSRLVTLTGSGGIGKTRLALEFAWQVPELFPDGVWLVDLATLTGPSVAAAVAIALGASFDDESKADEAVLAAISGKHLLLILDNCEYHVEKVAALADTILAGTSTPMLLVTTQEVLRIAAEEIIRLNPLALPPAGVVDIGKFASVVLLAERAQAADRRFALNARNALDISEICRSLDGIPLALEIAASWFPVLGVAGVRAELDKLLLFPGRRMAEQRHRTMQDVVEWSHNLLDPDDQIVFRRLGVFAGTFALDAAVAVAEPDADRWSVINAIGRLIDKSLVAVEGLEPPRYRLLETLRLFAAQKLSASDETARISERHATYYLDFLSRIQAERHAMPFVEFMARRAVEWENTRAAIIWSLAERDRAPLAIRLVAEAGNSFFQQRGLVGEGERFTQRALEWVDSETPPAIAAQLYDNASNNWFNRDAQRALPLLQRAASLFLEANDPVGFAKATTAAGYMMYQLGQYEDANKTFTQIFEISPASGIGHSWILAVCGLGMVAKATNDLSGSRQQFARALDHARAQKDDFYEQYALIEIAEIDFIEGDVDAAITLLRSVVESLTLLNLSINMDSALVTLAAFLIAQENLAEARELALRALDEFQDGYTHIYAFCLEIFALLAALEGRLKQAAKLVGFLGTGKSNASESDRTAVNYVRLRLAQVLQDGLPEAERQGYYAESGKWSDEQAIAYTRTELIAQRGNDHI